MFYLATLLCIACSAVLTLFFTVSRKAFTSMDAIEFKQLSEKLLNKKDTNWWSENLNYVIGGLLIVTSFFQF